MREILQQLPGCSIIWIPSGSCLGNCACRFLVLLLRIQQHTHFLRYVLYINSGNAIIIEETDVTIGKRGRVYLCCPHLREIYGSRTEVSSVRGLPSKHKLCKKARVTSKTFFKSNKSKSTVTNKVIL